MTKVKKNSIGIVDYVEEKITESTSFHYSFIENKTPLIFNRETYNRKNFRLLMKIFGIPENQWNSVQEIKVTGISKVEYFRDETVDTSNQKNGERKHKKPVNYKKKGTCKYPEKNQKVLKRVKKKYLKNNKEGETK